MNLRTTKITKCQLQKELNELPNYDRLNLAGSQIRSDGISEICKFANLSELSLDGTMLINGSLSETENIEHLTTLFLAKDKIINGSLKGINELNHLTTIYLVGTKVTDAGLNKLSELKLLQFLYLYATLVTDPGRQETSGSSAESASHAISARLPTVHKRNIFRLGNRKLHRDTASCVLHHHGGSVQSIEIKVVSISMWPARTNKKSANGQQFGGDNRRSPTWLDSLSLRDENHYEHFHTN